MTRAPSYSSAGTRGIMRAAGDVAGYFAYRRAKTKGVTRMQCSDLREIADSCLSDDLMIKNDNEALEHLELCDDCLREVVDRRNLRAMLRTAVMREPASQMSDEFAARLRARLRIVPSLWSPI